MKRPLVVLAAAALAGSIVAACTLFHGDFPDEPACTSALDCFEAQGETCDTNTGQCVIFDAAPPRIDSAPVPDSPPVPDAPPTPDAGPDAGIDAAVVDGGLPDA